MFKWYRLVGWYNNAVNYTWRIIGSHVFFGLVALVVAWYTWKQLQAIPDGPNATATKAGVIQAGAVILGLFSVLVAALQVRINATWNKVLSYHNFFGELITPQALRNLMATAKACGFSEKLQTGDELSQEDVAKIVDSPSHEAIISCYLDEFEEFCAAVNAGVVDNEYAYKLEGSRVVRVHKLFASYIRHCRGDDGANRSIYAELEHRANDWTVRKDHEFDLYMKRRKKAERLAEKLNRQYGVGPRV